LNGTSRVYSYAESLSVFKPDSEIILRSPDGQEITYEINWVKPHTRGLLLALKGVSDRIQAEKLIGCELLIEKASLPEPEDGTYYWFDLIGLSVFTTEDKFLGRIESIITTGSNDVYVVKPPDGDEKDEVLIPALASVVVDIDLIRQKMQVDLPEGL
jgi:16S rRNA processing protein RimM